jgi:hypothetical protein
MGVAGIIAVIVSSGLSPQIAQPPRSARSRSVSGAGRWAAGDGPPMPDVLVGF